MVSPLLNSLGKKRRFEIEKRFENYVSKAQGKQYKEPFAGLTKDTIKKNNAIKKLWTYWYLYAHNFDSVHQLECIDGIESKRLQTASFRLDALTFRLWKLAQMEEHEVAAKIEHIEKFNAKFSNSKVGEFTQAIDHLRAAALCLGYQADHFYRLNQANSIRELQGESETEYEARQLAANAYELRLLLGYQHSRNKEPSLATHALRHIWPLFTLDVMTCKQLFLSENGRNGYGAAIQSILTMASSDFKLATGSIKNYLASIESRS